MFLKSAKGLALGTLGDRFLFTLISCLMLFKNACVSTIIILNQVRQRKTNII